MTAVSRPIKLDQAPSSSGHRPPHKSSGGGLARHDGVVAILVYVAVSLFWYRNVTTHMDANCACGLGLDPGDGADFVWWFEWFVHALGHGLPLLHPTAIWSPTGINLAGTTASLLLAAVVSPITLLWGPIVSLNVVMILAPALSAWAANRLCRHITGAAWPSLLAGATYGFSTYEIAQLVGHPQMVVMICPPLVALCVIRLLEGTLPARRFVIEVSGLLIVQAFLSVEVLFTMTLVGMLAVAAYLATGTPEQRHELTDSLWVLALPYLIAGIASSWYLLQVLRAPAYAAGAGASLYPTDGLSFFVPMPSTWIGGATLSSVTARFLGGPTETGAYLGLPLLLILGRYVITRRHTQTARVLAILMALLAIWIVGPNLYVAGHTVARLPYSLISSLPLLNETMPGRTAIYLALVAAVALAIWLASPRRLTLVGWACAAIALACVLPNLASPSANNVSAWTNPAFFRTPLYRRYLRQGETVLPINWGQSGESFMWQAEDHMYWNMASGYWLFAPPVGWRSRVTQDLWVNSPRPGDGPLMRALLIRRHVADVVVQDDSAARWRQTLRGAGLRATAHVGGVTVYRVPLSWTARRTVTAVRLPTAQHAGVASGPPRSVNSL